MPELNHTAAIALGSNLSSPFGDPAANLHVAVERLGALGRVRAVSSFRVTAPVGYKEQPDFVNGAAVLATSLGPLALLHGLLAIEHAMGRRRENSPAKGPRIIDLDLLFFDEVVLASAELTLPHPALEDRRFVLEPLAEIAPGWRHPRSSLSAGELLARQPQGE